MSLFKRPDSEVWWANITHAGERLRFSTDEYDKAAAQRVHDERKAALHKQPALKGKKWSDAVARWLEAKHRSDTEIMGLAKFGIYFSDRLLSNVTPDAIDRSLSSFCTTAATYTRHRARINHILALSDVNIKLRRREVETAREPRWLTHEEWDKLAAELPTHMRMMATFAITTGLRQANVLKLQWKQVDVPRKLVIVDATDAKGRRTFPVPLSQKALDVLAEAEGQNSEFVFTYNGQPVSEIKTAFIKACCRAGLGTVSVDAGSLSPTGKPRVQYSGFTWHGFRHTWATWHVQNGTPLDVLQRLGGWADYKMVLLYAHHAPGYLAGFADNTEKKK